MIYYISICLNPIHKTCSSCNLTYSPSAHCSEIFRQSSICFITDFFAESDFSRISSEISSNNSIWSTIMPKKKFHASVAARQVPVAYCNVKIEQKGSSHYHNDTRMSFDFLQRLFLPIYRRRISPNTLILHIISYKICFEVQIVHNIRTFLRAWWIFPRI